MKLVFSFILTCVLWMNASALSCELDIHARFNNCIQGFNSTGCLASVDRVATCIENANKACGDDHVITDILSGQRVKDAGPYLCSHMQDFILSTSCTHDVRQNTCQFENVWGTSCPANGLTSTSERLCYFYDRTLDCYEQHAGSCSGEYVKIVRKFFPSNCGGTGSSVPALKSFTSAPSSEFNDDMCVYEFMRRFQVCLQTKQTGTCSAWVESIASCIEASNTCGDDHLIGQVLNGQRFRNAGPSICGNQQSISSSSSCLQTTGVLLQTCNFYPLWDAACTTAGLSSMADRVCLSYENLLDCYHRNTGSCGYDYVNWVRQIFPNSCGGTGGTVTGLTDAGNGAHQNSFYSVIPLLASSLAVALALNKF